MHWNEALQSWLCYGSGLRVLDSAFWDSFKDHFLCVHFATQHQEASNLFQGCLVFECYGFTVWVLLGYYVLDFSFHWLGPEPAVRDP